MMSKTFIKIESECNTLKFQDEPAKNPRFNIHCFDVILLIFPN